MKAVRLHAYHEPPRLDEVPEPTGPATTCDVPAG